MTIEGQEEPLFRPPFLKEQWAEIKPKTTLHERIIWAIYGTYPPAEELISRTPEEVAKLNEEVRQRIERREIFINSNLPTT